MLLTNTLLVKLTNKFLICLLPLPPLPRMHTLLGQKLFHSLLFLASRTVLGMSYVFNKH